MAAKNISKGGRSKAFTISFGALMAAAGTAVMLLGALLPVLTYCSPLLASLFLLPVIYICGKKSAVMVWAVTALLSLLIGADKETAFFYLFFGWYPAAKQGIDGIEQKILRFAVKLILFSSAAVAMYAFTCYVLGIEEIIEGFSEKMWINCLFLAAVVLCMLLFDLMLKRLAPRIRRLTEKITKR